ncbi:TetR/AcrR family transcriptional regulator [Mesorhizobium sp. B2-4-8]|uniref:TetR/AcrR family transcriptional regulator n=1 Tax=Mesorhizobium sp. B2-4-8 TaxID=2589941 RepID=UPI0011262058|nr:TetR/AcrR family transcriptional regulator [Mesorhizobium sp. B2-4-8]TPL35535.1 TetR/AcrR family transcriptional regulator [Mesorhizobium sp. B2-4-8]
MAKQPSTKKRKPRSGSKRGDLSRDKLIASAIELIDEGGADALTMRALADLVGVTPMALYNHFSSKRDLLAAVAEHIIGAAHFDGQRGDWREQIGHCFEILRTLCLQHPGLPGLLEQDGVAPGTAFAPMEVTLRALRSQGMSELDSVRTFFLLIGFTLSQASYQARPIPALEPSEKIRTERIAGRGFKTVERLEMPPQWDFDASFAFGISLILNGVEATISKH